MRLHQSVSTRLISGLLGQGLLTLTISPARIASVQNQRRPIPQWDKLKVPYQGTEDFELDGGYKSGLSPLSGPMQMILERSGDWTARKV